MNSAKDIAGIEVTSPDGETIKLGHLWRTRPIVLAFIRHFG
jgi:hypothetical protein